MTNKLKKQFEEAKQEKDPILRLEKLEELRSKTVLLMRDNEPEPNKITKVDNLLDMNSICKN